MYQKYIYPHKVSQAERILSKKKNNKIFALFALSKHQLYMDLYILQYNCNTDIINSNKIFNLSNTQKLLQNLLNQKSQDFS